MNQIESLLLFVSHNICAVCRASNKFYSIIGYQFVLAMIYMFLKKILKIIK